MISRGFAYVEIGTSPVDVLGWPYHYRNPMNSSQATIFEEVGAKLLQAGWVEIFTLENGSVCGLKWTAEGEQQGLLLRSIIGTFGLASSAAHVKQFTDDCENGAATMEEGSRDVGKNFWLACLDELSLARDIDALWVFVRMIEVGDELATLSLTSPELANRRLRGIVGMHG